MESRNIMELIGAVIQRQYDLEVLRVKAEAVDTIQAVQAQLVADKWKSETARIQARCGNDPERLTRWMNETILETLRERGKGGEIQLRGEVYKEFCKRTGKPLEPYKKAGRNYKHGGTARRIFEDAEAAPALISSVLECRYK